MGKKGAVNWTVGKLINIILLVIILVLVIYGTTTGGINPLLEKIEMGFDEVGFMINSFFGGASESCSSSKVSEMGGGGVFLKELGAGSEVVFSVCKNGVCNISGIGIGSYRVDKGKFEKLIGESWIGYDSFDGVTAGKLDWERYNAGVDLLEDLRLREVYDNAFSGQFILYGDGSGLNDKVFAIWQNGRWSIVEGEDWETEFLGGTISTKKTIRYVGSDDNVAINVFIDIVKGGNDDAVSYEETQVIVRGREYPSFESKPLSIEGLVGDTGFFSSSDEIDSDEEVVKLKSEFARIKKKLLNATKLSDGDLEKMRALNGKSISVNGKDFSVSVEENFMEGGFKFPLIVFSSGEEKFGLKFDAFGKVNSGLLEDIKLRYFPVSLIKGDGLHWEIEGDEEIYRLPENRFKEAYEASIINEFLRSKCK